MLQRLTLVLSVFFMVATQVATAQPPSIRRWTERTANTPPQGFEQGDPLVLTWSIVPDGTPLGGDRSSNLISYLNGIYANGFDEFQPILQGAVGRWGEFSGLTIQFEPNDDAAMVSDRLFAVGRVGVRGDIRFSGRFVDGDAGILALADAPADGDIAIDTGDDFFFNTANNSINFRNVMTHEFGHGLGFFMEGHVTSSDTRQLLEPIIDVSFDGPQYHDILAAQRAYGDVFETGAGNDTVSNATDLGVLLGGDSVVIGEAAHRTGTSVLFSSKPTGIEILPDEVDFFSIDGQSDTDMYSFTVDQAGTANIVLDIVGESYMAGTEFQSNEILFVTSERSDLTLEFLDTDGQTVLATSDTGGFGDDEILSAIPLDAGGTYFVRITGVDNPDALELDVQFYGLSVAFESPLLGDVNLDGQVDFLDIGAFVDVLLDSGQFQVEADINQDGVVNFLDIGGFVSILIAS